MSMRIIILTHNSERHYYFCNKIIENSNKVVGVITGGKYYQKNKVDRLKELIIKKRFLKAIKNKLLNIYYKKFHTRLIKEKNSVEEKFFGGSKSIFNKQHKHLLISSYNNKYKSINDDYFVSLIREKNPDVILVMGTCLLDEKILSSAKHVINLHTGLSPYYRGAWTNLIPFIDDNYGYFGVTIHKLSLGIDSGDIIYSACPEINSSDNYSTINSKSIITQQARAIAARPPS